MIPPNARVSLLEMAHVWQRLTDQQGRATNGDRPVARCSGSTRRDNRGRLPAAVADQKTIN